MQLEETIDIVAFAKIAEAVVSGKSQAKDEIVLKPNSEMFVRIETDKELESLAKWLIRLTGGKLQSEEAIIKAFQQTVTHPGKLVNAASSLTFVALPGRQPGEETHPFFWTCDESKFATLSGSAADQPTRFLFETGFAYQGKKTTFGSLVREGNPAAMTALEAAGVTTKNLADQPCTNIPDHAPQILWPLKNGGYVAVSAIPSVAAVNRIRSENATGETNCRPVFVGGANPQNAGSLLAASRGRIPILSSVLYGNKRGLSQIEGWIAKKVFRKPVKRVETLAAKLEVAASIPKGNRRIEQIFSEVAQELAETFYSPAVALRAWADQKSPAEIDEKLKGYPENIVAFVSGTATGADLDNMTSLLSEQVRSIYSDFFDSSEGKLKTERTKRFFSELLLAAVEDL